MLRKNANLPDDDHVMRYVPWKKLRRDEDDNIIGLLPQAFEHRPGEKFLSISWIEYFPVPETRVRDSVWAMRKALKVGTNSAFGIGQVGKVKQECLLRGAKIRIVYEPEEGEPAHAAMRQVPRDDLTLLAALAEDAFTEMVKNVDIPPQPHRPLT